MCIVEENMFFPLNKLKQGIEAFEFFVKNFPLICLDFRWRF